MKAHTLIESDQPPGSAFSADPLDIRNQVAQQLNRQAILGKDEIIKAAISKHIGDDWKVEDLAGRLHSTVRQSDGLETWILDGKAIAFFMPPEFNQNDEDLKTTISLTIRHQIL